MQEIVTAFVGEDVGIRRNGGIRLRIILGCLWMPCVE